MSSVSNIVDAANVQRMLSDGFNGMTNLVSEGAPTLEFLNSPFNTDGVMQSEMVPQNRGKEQIFELVYQQRRLENEIFDTADPVCTGGETPGDLSTTYNLDTTAGASFPWTIKIRELETALRSNEMWVSQEIQRVMDSLVRKINQDVTDKLALNVGTFRDGTSSKTVATKSGQANAFEAYEEWLYEMRELEYRGVPAVFGWGEAYKYMKAIDANCCADTGRDLRTYAEQNDLIFIADRSIDTSFGADNVLVMAPGAAQFIQYNQFSGPEGINSVSDQTYTHGILTDPVTGVSFDYTAKLDCGEWHFQLKTAYDVFFMPSDMFRVDDPLYGTNWLLQFAISN